MDNDDELFSRYKFGSQPAPQAQQNAPSSSEDPFEKYAFSKPYRTDTEPHGPPMPEPEATPAGYGKAVASGAMSGAAAIPGQFGDVQQLTNVVPVIAGELGLAGLEKVRKYFNRPDTPEYQRYVEEARRALADTKKVGESLREYNLPNMILQNLPKSAKDWMKEKVGIEKIYAPTTEEIKSAVDPYATQAFGVGPNYEPENKKEKLAKEMTSFGTQAIAGPGKLVPRLVTGTAAGAGSELARQKAEGTGYEVPAQIAGSLIGGVTPSALYGAGKQILNPNQIAKETLGDVGKQYSVGSAKPIRTMAQMDIQEAAENIPQRFKDFTKRLTGVKQDLPPLQQLVDDAAAAERTRIYNVARNEPAAQSIDNNLFTGLMERPDFKKAMEEAMVVGQNAPHFGIVPPSQTGGGNLAYWDQVKRILGEKSSNAFQSATERSATKGNYLSNMSDELTAILDNAVSAYPIARDVASNTFKASNAAVAGMQFMKNIDVFERDAVKAAIKQYSPEQRKLFNAGVMQTLTDAVENGNLEGLARKFLKNDIFQDKLRAAMGENDFNVLRGKVLSENMIGRAWDLGQRLQASSAAASASTSPFKTGAISGLAGLALESQFAQQFIAQLAGGQTGTLAVGALLAGAAGQAVKNAQDRRIADRMIGLIQKNDINSYREIDRLTKQHPDLYKAIIAPLTATAVEGEREGRASGGKVTGSIAQRLVAAAEKAHKYHQKTTEEILDAPDETVVKALAVAKKNI